MHKSQPLTGTPARASEPAVQSVRPGQVPQSERSLARLCFLSVSKGELAPLEARTSAWQRLSTLGLGVALAIDAAERRTLGWEAIAGLVKRAGELELAPGFVAGAGPDLLASAGTIGDELEAASAQASVIEEAGGIPLLLPLAALSRRRAREDEYVEAYRALLARLSGPVLVDWTGPQVRPELAGYFPNRSFERVLALDPAKVRGARFALGDVARETRLRRELAQREQLLFTADRAHLGHLLLGLNPGPAAPRVPEILRDVDLGGQRVALGDFSHALLALSPAEAETLAQALADLAVGDAAGCLRRLAKKA
jgi:hypothetical protein